MYFAVKCASNVNTPVKDVSHQIAGFLRGVLKNTNKSFISYGAHPEILRQRNKQKDAQSLCKVFESEEYKNKVASILELQYKLLCKTTPEVEDVTSSSIKYQHVLSCAQPAPRSSKKPLEKPVKAIYKPYGKKQKKTTAIEMMLKMKKGGDIAQHEGDQKSVTTATKEVLTRKKSSKVIRRRTTIMPIILKKFQETKSRTDTTVKEEDENESVDQEIPGEMDSRLIGNTTGNAHVDSRGLRTFAMSKTNGAGKNKKQKLTARRNYKVVSLEEGLFRKSGRKGSRIWRTVVDDDMRVTNRFDSNNQKPVVDNLERDNTFKFLAKSKKQAKEKCVQEQLDYMTLLRKVRDNTLNKKIKPAVCTLDMYSMESLDNSLEDQVTKMPSYTHKIFLECKQKKDEKFRGMYENTANEDNEGVKKEKFSLSLGCARQPMKVPIAQILDSIGLRSNSVI